MPRIELRNRAGEIVDYAIVEPDEEEWLRSLGPWHLSGGYVTHGHLDRYSGKIIHVKMHRLILGLTKGDGLEGDHINRNKLDNRWANLRRVPHRVNVANCSPSGAVPFRGVSYHDGKYQAQAMKDGTSHYLGFFDTAEEAGAVAREWRLENTDALD